DVDFFVGAALVRCVVRYVLIVRLWLLRWFASSRILWLSYNGQVQKPGVKSTRN
ncbi:MAG: hypothetical protein RLZZ435_128, partial [Cyanobacteriota bacterium]